MFDKTHIRQTMDEVVEFWWEKSGKDWAMTHDSHIETDPRVDSKPYYAFATLLRYPQGKMYIVDIDNPRVCQALETIHANPDALLKLLEIQYEEAHRKNNQ
jgi:hypothetical protein